MASYKHGESHGFTVASETDLGQAFVYWESPALEK